jgi:ketosteroid isomerase-like protein
MPEWAPAEVVAGLWARIQARDWDGVRALLADDAVVDWPHTGERMASAEAYVGLNRNYPEGWTIDVRSIVAEGDRVASLVRVPLGEEVSWVASFFDVREGRIVRAVELWVDLGKEEPPAWRAAFAERYDPRT